MSVTNVCVINDCGHTCDFLTSNFTCTRLPCHDGGRSLPTRNKTSQQCVDALCRDVSSVPRRCRLLIQKRDERDDNQMRTMVDAMQKDRRLIGIFEFGIHGCVCAGDMQAAKRVGRYLRKAPVAWQGYPFRDPPPGSLLCYADADWASDKTSRRSTRGGVVGGGVLNCWAKKQRSVALSSWESELFSAFTSGTHSLGLLRAAHHIDLH